MARLNDAMLTVTDVASGTAFVDLGYYPTTTDGTADNTTYYTDSARTIWPDGHMYQIANEKEEVKEMRGLFHTIVIEYKTNKILEDSLVIAKDKETAKVKVLAPFAEKYELDDLDVICNRLGDVRKKKEIQKVCVVKDD